MRAETSARDNNEIAEIGLQSMLGKRKDPPPGRHPIQSSPTKYRTPHFNGI